MATFAWIALALARPDYLNPNLTPRTRALDLVRRMTTQEEIGQMMHQAQAIPRLGIKQYNWWSESLHGVAKPGNVTVYPQVIGLGATWDTALVGKMADQISTEERARWNYQKTHPNSGFDQGLDSWAPNINIFRDPRWGRGQETYGEDPFLTGQMAIHYIQGLQGTNPLLFKTIATPKHYAVHSGPDPMRHRFSANVTNREAWLTFLPAFQDAITVGGAWSIMSAYSSYNGVPDSANHYLLGAVLRRRWGFNGYVVSDCGAIDDIYAGHHFVATKAEAAAIAVKAGCDLECGDAYTALKEALAKGYVTKADLDRSVERLMEARVRLGMFDKRTQWDGLTMSSVDSASHRETALKLAEESLVLLKNSRSTLPLKPSSTRSILCVGPQGNNQMVLLGNYNGMNSHIVTPVAGLRHQLGESKVAFDQACGIETIQSYQPISSNWLKVTGTYYKNQTLSGKPILVRPHDSINWIWSGMKPFGKVPQNNFSVRWKGTLTAPRSGSYTIVSNADDGIRVFLDGQKVIDDWGVHPAHQSSYQLDMTAGESQQIVVEYFQAEGEAVAELGWVTPGGKPFQSAIAAAKKAGTVIAFVGISGAQEGEENDRKYIGLPTVQLDLLKAIRPYAKKLVVVYINGGAISDPWSKQHADAILEAWYPGEEGGDAIANALLGKYSPSGRLPVTVVRSMADLPDFQNYHMEGRTYRYDAANPLYSFGFGLSYARFRVGQVLAPKSLEIGKQLIVRVKVTNMSSTTTADDVVEMYIHHGKPSLPMPDLSLKSFGRVHLLPHQSKWVTLTALPRDLAVVHANTTFWEEAESLDLYVGDGPAGSDTKRVVELVGHPHLETWPKQRSQ